MFYLLYKPKGITSFKFINEFKRINQFKKIGHTGTLDPLAQGLLLVATNNDTKLIRFLDEKPKKYFVGLKLGISTNTYDLDGEIIAQKKVLANEKLIIKTILSFVGNIKQIPPIFSAKKIQGQRAYNLARQKIAFELKPIFINIQKINNIKIKKNHEIFFEALVSRGTYIRSLVNDIGEKLNCGATMIFLERNQINGLSLEYQNQPLSFEKISSIKTYEAKDFFQIKNIFDGKEIKLPSINDQIFALKFKDNILGVFKNNDQKIIALTLIGHNFQKMKKYYEN